MKSLFDSENRQIILNRIESLTKTSQPNWGKMDVAQMLTHCQKPLEVATGMLQLNTQIGFGKKILFKLFKSAMYNDKPWRKNLGTVREFRITDNQVFMTQKEKLINVINAFSQLKEKTSWPAHPLFGDFTSDQWGKMQYKHLDHHLTQFGV